MLTNLSTILPKIAYCCPRIYFYYISWASLVILKVHRTACNYPFLNNIKIENSSNSKVNTINNKSQKEKNVKAATPQCQCFFKAHIMWIVHIVIHNNPLGVKSSQRTDASLMLYQTYAFYLVTRQLHCSISIAEPAGNALIQCSSGWQVWKQASS